MRGIVDMALQNLVLMFFGDGLANALEYQLNMITSDFLHVTASIFQET